MTELYDALITTRAMRRFTDEPVSDDDIWALHTPGRRVLLVRSDGCYSYERGRSEPRWRPRR